MSKRKGPSNAELFLVERGWYPLADGRFRHPMLHDAWPVWAAERLEKEDDAPLAARRRPWRSVEKRSAAELIAQARELIARPCVHR